MAKSKKRFVPLIEQALPVPIVDNHTHLAPDPTDLEQQRVDDEGRILPPVLLATLLEGMRQAGVRAAISSGCELPELEPTLGLAQTHDELWAALAIHPNEAAMHAGVLEKSPDGWEHEPQAHHLDYSLDAAIERVAQLALDPCVVAVGETGLDYFRTSEAGVSAQKQAFRDHIALAKELGKPLQIHDRDAHADVVATLLADGAPERTVFHCFSGDAELAQICAEHGWYASFAGPLTYPPNEDLRQAFLALPEELILVETDAPYLTPVPYRGHPNTVWGAAYTVRFQAELRGQELAQWCAIVDRNTRDVYGI